MVLGRICVHDLRRVGINGVERRKDSNDDQSVVVVMV